jgi:hypothetical protein
MTERPDSGRPRRDGASSRPQRPGAPKRDGFKPRAGRDDAASKPRGARSGGRPMRNGEATDERPAWQTRVAGAIRSDKPKSPPIPEEITAGDLEMPIRVQLKTLSAENAEMVARHLVMTKLLIEQDPELAHRHALAAVSRAGRIAIVRETVGITAYTVGDFAMALRELLSHRRMTASNDQLPLIVDSERGLNRPERALEVGRGVDRNKLNPLGRVNLAIAMSGARLDLGQNELALAELEIKELDASKVFEFSAPLFWAYSDTLELLGRTEESKKWAKLAERAEAAFAVDNSGDNETFAVLEEIEIPEMTNWKPRD